MKIRIQAGMAALLFAVAMPLAAQQQPQAGPRPNGPMGPGMLGVELAMRQKEQLKLTDAQVSQLDAIRKEIVAERQERARQMIDVQSRVAAGLIKGEDVRQQFQSQREQNQKLMEQRRDRIAKILTQDQQDQLRRMERRMMVQRVRRQGFRPGFGGQFGPGMRGRFGPGFGGQFGPGFGPGRPGAPGRPWWFDDQN